MYRPAGMSDEEDFDQDEDGFYYGFGEDYNHESDGGELDGGNVAAANSSRPKPYSSVIEGFKTVDDVKAFLQNEPYSEPDVQFLYEILRNKVMTACADICDYLLNNYSLDVNVKCIRPLPCPLLKSACAAKAPETEVLRCVRLLISKGADVNAPGLYRISPLMECCESGFYEVAKLLISHGADVNAKDIYNNTCLFYAVRRGKEDIVKMLLDCGAQKDAEDGRGRKPRDIALMKGYNEIARLFKSAEASNENSDDDEEEEEDPLHASSSEILQSLGRYSFVINSILKDKNLGVYYKNIKTSGLKLDEFLTVSDQQLKDIGFRFSIHRREIQLAAKSFVLSKSSPESFGCTNKKPPFILADSFSLLCNICYNMCVLRSKLSYLRIYHSDILSSDEKLLSPVVKRCYQEMERSHMHVEQLMRIVEDIRDRNAVFPPPLMIKPDQTNAKYSTKVYIICTVIGCSVAVCIILKKWGSFN